MSYFWWRWNSGTDWSLDASSYCLSAASLLPTLIEESLSQSHVIPFDISMFQITWPYSTIQLTNRDLRKSLLSLFLTFDMASPTIQMGQRLPTYVENITVDYQTLQGTQISMASCFIDCETLFNQILVETDTSGCKSRRNKGSHLYWRDEIRALSPQLSKPGVLPKFGYKQCSGSISAVTAQELSKMSCALTKAFVITTRLIKSSFTSW